MTRRRATLVLFILLFAACVASGVFIAHLTLGSSPQVRSLSSGTVGDDGFPEIDWEGLLSENPNVIGWVSVPGTGISQPIVASPPDDPDYYLYRNLSGERDAYGTPFLDSSCEGGLLASDVSVVYGHHMNDGSVFSELADYVDEDFLTDNPEIYIQTPEHKVKYRVLCARIVNASSETTVTDFPSAASFRTWLDGFVDLYAPGSQMVSGCDRILELVTCSYTTYANERTCVYAWPAVVDGKAMTGGSSIRAALGDTTSELLDQTSAPRPR